MFTWLEAAVMCEELYGAETNMKEGYFVCPECGSLFSSAIGVNTMIGPYVPFVAVCLRRVNYENLVC
jgi:hypothetical protein